MRNKVLSFPLLDLNEPGAYKLTPHVGFNETQPRWTKCMQWFPLHIFSLQRLIQRLLLIISNLYPLKHWSPSCTLKDSWSNHSPLICLFNLIYLLWIYFNSSTHPKIMKFSPKIPKFMMITSIILIPLLPLFACVKNSLIKKTLFYSHKIPIYQL
jgi:hypothetical protein